MRQWEGKKKWKGTNRKRKRERNKCFFQSPSQIFLQNEGDREGDAHFSSNLRRIIPPIRDHLENTQVQVCTFHTWINNRK